MTDPSGQEPREPLTLAQRDHAIEQVMERYHHVGPDHIPADDPVGECPECADIVGMLLTVERYAVERAEAQRTAPGLREAALLAARDFHMAAFRGQWPGVHASSVIEDCPNEFCRAHVARLALSDPASTAQAGLTVDGLDDQRAQARVLLARWERGKVVEPIAGPRIDQRIVDGIWLAEVLTSLNALAAQPGTRAEGGAG